jgi:hypothetical protein
MGVSSRLRHAVDTIFTDMRVIGVLMAPFVLLETEKNMR